MAPTRSVGPAAGERTACDALTFDASYAAAHSDWHERVVISAPFVHVPTAGLVNVTRAPPGTATRNLWPDLTEYARAFRPVIGQRTDRQVAMM